MKSRSQEVVTKWETEILSAKFQVDGSVCADSVHCDRYLPLSTTVSTPNRYPLLGRQKPDTLGRIF